MSDKPKKTHVTTTLRMTQHLHTQLKLMCTLTRRSMGDFIRISVIDKINQLKDQQVK